MDKFIRTIRIITDTQTVEIKVNVRNELIPERREFSSIFVAYSGERQKQTTGNNFDFGFSFPYCTQEVLDFFLVGFESGGFVFERENDDGTFTTFNNSFMSQPQYKDRTVVEGFQKIYQNLTLTVFAK